MIKQKRIFGKNPKYRTKRLLPVLIFTATAIGMGAFLYTCASTTSATKSPLYGYTQVWGDEFSGDALDRTKWTYQSGAWSSDGVQNCYTWDNKDNVSVDSGLLKITARYTPGQAWCGGEYKNFTSGFIQTRDGPGQVIKDFRNGYFEARIKMPENKSTWPSFWMSPSSTTTYGPWPASGEIDIVESKGSDLTYMAGNAHYVNDAGSRKHHPGVNRTTNMSDWHTYAVRWEGPKLEYYFDGQLYHTINANSNYSKYVDNDTSHPFDRPFYLRLNVAVGGTYINPSATETSPYSDPSTAVGTIQGFAETLPSTMEVDYVRVYQRIPTATFSYSTGATTNKDVIVTMKTSTEVRTPDGWSKVSGTEFTKVFSENTAGNITVNLVDTVGNKGSTTYTVTNIDKSPLDEPTTPINSSTPSNPTTPTSPTAPPIRPSQPQTATISGRAQPGATVSIRDRAGSTIATTTADSSGNFAVEIEKEQDEDSHVEVSAIDKDGNEARINDFKVTPSTLSDNDEGLHDSEGEDSDYGSSTLWLWITFGMTAVSIPLIIFFMKRRKSKD